MPFKADADRRHHIPGQMFKVTNWRDYDTSLRGRGSLTAWFTEEAIASWKAEPRTTRDGQPIYSGVAMLTALTLRAVFRLTSVECVMVLHEVAVDAELFAQDQEIVGIGLSPQDRATALIRRDDDRMAARFRQSPGPIAAEIARLQACQVFDDGDGRDSAASSDRRCL